MRNFKLRVFGMLLGTMNLPPGVRYRFLIGLWTNFIVFNFQVVERVLIFANPVFKNSGIHLISKIIYKQLLSGMEFPSVLGQLNISLNDFVHSRDIEFNSCR